jgi:S1-C subfamily serine protease
MRLVVALAVLALAGVIGSVPIASAQVTCEGGTSAVVEAPRGLTLCRDTVKVPVVTHDEPQAGVRVAALDADSPFARAGLTAGDVIYRVRFTRVTTADEVLKALGGLKVEHGLVVNFWRGDQPYLVRVWIGSP